MDAKQKRSVSEVTVDHPDVQVHPDYNGMQDSDLILVSSDGQTFRVHSIIMKLAFDVFKTMIDVGPSDIAESSKESIVVQEDSKILKGLLDIIYLNRPPFTFPIPSFTHFRDICYAAEKYEMSGALESIRMCLRLSTSNFPPLLAIALASRYDWTEELRMISTETLGFDLYTPELTQQLQLLPSKVLLQLMEFHRKRRDLLVASSEPQGFTSGSSGPVPLSTSHSSVMYDNTICRSPPIHFMAPEWTILKYHLAQEMERKPDGSIIREQSFWDRREFSKLWETKCAQCCEVMDKYKCRAEVICVLESLPKTM